MKNGRYRYFTIVKRKNRHNYGILPAREKVKTQQTPLKVEGFTTKARNSTKDILFFFHAFVTASWFRGKTTGFAEYL